MKIEGLKKEVSKLKFENKELKKKLEKYKNLEDAEKKKTQIRKIFG